MAETKARKIDLSFNDTRQFNIISKIARALSSEDRLTILNYLNNGPKNINEIADGLSMPLSTVAFHINILNEAGLILTEYYSTKKGHIKLCSRYVTDVYLNIWNKDMDSKNKIYSYSMPIGMFTDSHIVSPCGYAGKQARLIEYDSPNEFYSPIRQEAQLLWFKEGYICYDFPIPDIKSKEIEEIEVSLELCSEIAFHKEDYPSDISFFINDLYIGMHTCPGDYGDRRGKLNPPWWPSKNTQYGDLLTIKINKDGTFFDGNLINKENNIAQVSKIIKDKFRLKIAILDSAVHKGGINIFGECFGNYKQDILLKISTKK